MVTTDLQNKFLDALFSKIPNRPDLINEVADILRIEKDAAYRRLSGKVNFSVREIGIIADKLHISLDRLIGQSDDVTWLPFLLAPPLKIHSMDSLFEVVDEYIQQMGYIVGGPEPTESGNIYNSLPMELYLYSPVLTKFMFFKWGHYFVGTEEFNHYGQWKLPHQVDSMRNKFEEVLKFDKSYYIFDQSLIWTLANEVVSIYKMHVMTADEKKEIKEALHDMLTRLEKTLSGTYTPSLGITREGELYISPINLGFTSNYFVSGDRYSISFQTNFSFSRIDNNKESFTRLKEWVDSFRNISTQISLSGRIERRPFFKTQHKLVDYLLR